MTQKRKFYGWTLLAIMWVIVAANSFPMAGASVINALMSTNMNLSRSTMGLIVGVFSWMTGMLGPVVAVCVNKKGVRFTLTMGSLMVVVGAALMATVVNNTWQATAVFGVLIGLAYTASGALAAQAGIVRWFTKSKSRVLSLLMTGTSVGAMIAPVALSAIIGGNPAHWRRGWWLVCACSAFAALLTLVAVKEWPSDLGQEPEPDDATHAAESSQIQVQSSVFRTTEEWSYAEVLRSVTFWLTVVPGIGFSMLLPLINAHGLRHLQDLGHTPAQAALSLSVLASAMFAGMLFVAAFGSQIDPRKLWSAGMLVLGLGVVWAYHAAGPVVHIAIPGLHKQVLWSWTGDLGLYGYAVVVGLGFGAAAPAAMAMISNYFGHRPYADIMGFLAVLSTTVGALAAYLAGLAFDHLGGYRVPYYGVALVCFAGCVILMFTKPPVRKKAPQAALAASGRV